MKSIILIAAIFSLVACGENNSSPKLGNPQDVQPPAEAIPDSTKIVNDSVIVPDTADAR